MDVHHNHIEVIWRGKFWKYNPNGFGTLFRGKEVVDAHKVNGESLPIVKYKGKRYFVDFRLGEIRDIATARSIPFSKIPGGVKSPFKAYLRGVRFYFWRQEYIPGLDD